MPSALDTRITKRARKGLRARPSAGDRSATRGANVDLALFRRMVRDLILGRRADRRVRLGRVVAHLRATRYPADCLNHLLFECATAGGTDGLDIAVDVVAAVGPLATASADRFFQADLSRRADLSSGRRYSANDDVWYILLRGLARADIALGLKLMAIVRGISHPSADVHESVVSALEDLVDSGEVVEKDVARTLLARIKTDSPTTSVQHAADEAIRDLEG